MNAPRLPSEIEHLPIEQLIPYARNSRTHSEQQVAQVAASIREFGFTNPVLIDAEGVIVAGHGRVMASRSLGLPVVPCIRLGHLTEAQRRAYVIADNKLAENAGWDETMLALELKELDEMDFALELTGFGGDEIDQLLASMSATKQGNTDPDAAPPVPAKADAVTRTGDVWQLGRHRVVCGDSTDPNNLARLLRGAKVDVCWTDPPYNVAYENAAGSIANDDMSDADFLEFLRRVFRAAFAVMKPGAAIYVAHADAGETGISFRRAFLDAGFKLAACLIWRKDALVLGRSDYQWIHEPILYGWRPGAAHKWFGGRAQTSVTDLGSSGSPFVRLPDGKWQVTIGEEVMVVAGDATVEYVEHSVLREAKPKRNDVHPTMKPVALIERQLRNNAKPGAVVLDLFGGSGSTLIAAEQLGMSAHLSELSPSYTDVIVRRWQEFTGQQAVLEADGSTFDFVTEARSTGIVA
jgi:DNA modification methylase